MPIHQNENGHYIYRTFYTRKDGVRVYARQYGKRAFRFWIAD